MKPTDYFGNEIEEGDIIAYPTSASSSASMNHGQVYSVRPYELEHYDWRTKETKTTTRFKLGVEKMGRASYGACQKDTNSTKVTLDKIERCINLSKVNLDKLTPQDTI